MTPDFSRFSIALPHVVRVDISLTRGEHWSQNRIPFTLFSSRPSIDARGFPVWGYEAVLSKVNEELMAVDGPGAGTELQLAIAPQPKTSNT